MVFRVLKPVFNSKNKAQVNEAKVFSSFMMANILKILHPFIPFFTETVWSINKYKTVLKQDLISLLGQIIKILKNLINIKMI